MVQPGNPGSPGSFTPSPFKSFHLRPWISDPPLSITLDSRASPTSHRRTFLWRARHSPFAWDLPNPSQAPTARKMSDCQGIDEIGRQETEDEGRPIGRLAILYAGRPRYV